MTNATADTMQRSGTVPPSQIATRSTFFCDDAKRRSHSEKGLSRFISCLNCFGYHTARRYRVQKTWVPRQTKSRP